MKRRNAVILAAILSLSLPLAGDVTKVPPTGSGVATSVTAGTTTVTGGTNNTVIYQNNTGKLTNEAAFGYVDSTDTLTFANATVTNSTLLGSGASYIVGAGNNDGILRFSSANTPDTAQLAIGPTANTWHVLEFGDVGFDFNNGPCGTAACTDPQVIVHSHNQDTTQYTSLGFTGISGGATKALPDTTATDVFRVAVPTDSAVGGVVVFRVFASDGTIQQSLSGMMQFSAVAEGTTETCPTPTAVGTNLNANTSGTLTCAFTCDVTPTNAVDIQFGCNPSLTLGTQTLHYQVFLAAPGEIIPQ